jgi:serine protease Do
MPALAKRLRLITLPTHVVREKPTPPGSSFLFGGFVAMSRCYPVRIHRFVIPFALIIPSIFFIPPVHADDAKDPKKVDIAAVLDKAAPESIEDLKAIQEQVKKVLEKVVPCTVNVKANGGQGSGVIVSEDGLVLTAAHVSGKADQNITITLNDGRKLKAKTLGANGGIDSGMIRITEGGKYPFAEMGKSSGLLKGQWVLTVGHPGGFDKARTPPVRLGRVLSASDSVIRTDCTLVGGDSGGPLFDMDGKVIGIHSRIGLTLNQNIHVPIDTYTETWERLVKGEVWGGGTVGFGDAPAHDPNEPYLGFRADNETKHVKVAAVKPDSPAEKAGLKVEDILRKLSGEEIKDFDDFTAKLKKKKAGDKITLEVERGDKTVTLEIVLGKWKDAK